jgi:hypothetical protein
MTGIKICIAAVIWRYTGLRGALFLRAYFYGLAFAGWLLRADFCKLTFAGWLL